MLIIIIVVDGDDSFAATPAPPPKTDRELMLERYKRDGLADCQYTMDRILHRQREFQRIQQQEDARRCRCTQLFLIVSP